MFNSGKSVKDYFDAPTILVVIILLCLLVYGGVSLVVETRPDPVVFSEDEQNLAPEEWLRLYEKKKQEQDQQEKRSFYRFFEFDGKE